MSRTLLLLRSAGIEMISVTWHSFLAQRQGLVVLQDLWNDAGAVVLRRCENVTLESSLAA